MERKDGKIIKFVDKNGYMRNAIFTKYFGCEGNCIMREACFFSGSFRVNMMFYVCSSSSSSISLHTFLVGI